MAYCNRNLLTKIIEIQELTLEFTKKGYTQTWVYKNLIRDRFYIAKSTYDKYLSINAKLELKKLEKNKVCSESEV